MIAAGIAALADQAWVQRAVEHNEVWLTRMTEALSAIGIGVTPSAANFLWLHFPKGNGRSAQAADKFLHQRRIILRRVEEYGLPAALRITIGSEEENRAVLDALTSFMDANGAARRMTKPLFDTLAIIGIGLIGSSIARAARAKGPWQHRDFRRHSQETRKPVSSSASPTRSRPTQAVEGADLVILCVPVGACGAVAENRPVPQARRHRHRCGFGQGLGRAEMAPHLPKGVHFVPAHPVAGTEHSGPDAGFAELFENRWCILTPPPGTDPAAVERLDAFWRRLGANVETMTAEHHDLVLAITSHVPHLIAYNIVGTAADLETVTRSEVIKFSAGGFRDFTRIAASDPTMWRDVFLQRTPYWRCSAASRRTCGAARPSAMARARGSTTLHPHPRNPPRHHRGRPGYGGADFGRPHGHED